MFRASEHRNGIDHAKDFPRLTCRAMRSDKPGEGPKSLVGVILAHDQGLGDKHIEGFGFLVSDFKRFRKDL